MTDRGAVGGRGLSHAVVEAVTARIVAGEIRPGEKLPTESLLMEQLGVSRTVVREGISRLQALGLVETYRGKGSFVLTRPTQETFSPSPSLLKTAADVAELLEFRIGVEAEASALAAGRRTPGQLDELSRRLQDFADAAGTPSRAIEADYAFHRSIAAATGNRYYLDLVASLGPTMIAMPPPRLRSSEAPDAQHFERVVLEHATIYASIERQDSQSAHAAMRIHLANSRTRLDVTGGPRSS